MVNDKERVEARLKAFYDRVPDVEDALPFKDYLLKHEDSRMAWYLLGKQYASKGQESKANYCFSQAGEIYEAFENKPVPELPAEQVNPPVRRSTRWLVLAAAAVLLVSGYLLYRGLSGTPDATAEPVGKMTESGAVPPADAGSGPSALPTKTAQPGNNGTDTYDMISGAAEPDADGNGIISKLVARSGTEKSLLIRTPKLGKWTDWVRSGTPVAAVSAGANQGTRELQWYDPKWCVCEPGDGKTALQAAAAWKPLQEMKLALRSAMMQHRAKTGIWPEDPQSLAGNYPENTIAGWTEDMTAWFDELKKVLDNKKDGKIPHAVGWPAASGPAAGTAAPDGQLAALAEQPLEIIVDKANHRLAVVSGNVLLRNYAVGLGGGKTPEGTFVISEKVRDPNGKTDGPFGNRGMTLSDTRYAIHGTNEPDSIGKDDSLGCIRVGKEDLEELYDLVPIGTKVTIMKEGLPSETRVPPKRFRLPSAQDETNPRWVYDWLY